MEFKMVKEMENMWAIHVIEAGEVIGSEAFDNFKECADRYVEVLLENGMEDDKVEESIISLFAIDESKYTGHIIDPFLSGWGCAKDKANKVFIICDNWNEAQIIKQRLLTQSTIKRASVSSGIPRFSREADYISLKTKVNCPEGWWWRDIIHEENGGK